MMINPVIRPAAAFCLVMLIAVLLPPDKVQAAFPSQYSRACTDCHGMPPMDSPYRNISSGGFGGDHQTHADDRQATCARCHSGSASYSFGHMTTVIKLSANVNGSPATGLYSVGGSPVSFKNRTSNPVGGTCSNVNCHFETVTPAWGSAPFSSSADCTACHSVPGPSTSHTKHDQYFSWGNNGCTKCHPDYVTGLIFNHATSASGRNTRVTLSEGSYSGTGANWLPSQSSSRVFGSCSDLYCHSNGSPFDKPADKKTVIWGSGPLSCTGCHDGPSDTTALSGKHARHVDPNSYGFTCERCHKDTVTGSDTIKDRSLHVNRTKDVAFKDGGSYNSGTRGCNSTYCHSDGKGGAPMRAVAWSDTAAMTCFSCHRGRTIDNTPTNCAAIGGVWDAGKGVCAPFINITTNGHNRLVGPQWIRKYPCYYCHDNTVDASGNIKNKSMHVNGTKDVAIAGQWAIVGRPAPTYNPATKTCDNTYCHSDGTTDPEDVRPVAWTGRTECNSCHGHPSGSCSSAGCHDGHIDGTGKVWTVKTAWPVGQEWMGAMPMFPNQGQGTARANSHVRHTQTDYTCDQCHAKTITAGTCTTCHANGIPSGTGMSEVAHIDGTYHVNKMKDVSFKLGGSYNPVTKSCSNTACHKGGSDPVWGGSVNSAVTCLSCHGTANGDVDSFAFKLYSSPAKINTSEWVTNGHGRPAASGNYLSGNPPANFPGNPCWYCHDDQVLHNDPNNYFRLRQHTQFQNRFEKECVYCHMEGNDSECLGCHNSSESLAPQLSALAADAGAKWPDGTAAPRPDHTVMTDGGTSCTTAPCHYVDPSNAAQDVKRHNTGAGNWTAEQKADVKNQYVMMGVCLKCHDDDTGGKCTSCHTAPPDNPLKYSVGFDPGTGFIKPQKAKATSAHFGYKHWRAFQQDGVWKGGKFCWDCHDPHGDSNIYMIQSKVATTTDGTFGIPLTRSSVVFTRKLSGLDYAKTSAPYNGICNVCHSSNAKHYTNSSGDGHNASKVCTSCHEHRFSDSHADGQACNTCHLNKPVPRHSAFGLPRDCVKCHAGTINMRMDIMGQFNGSSHHVQGIPVKNKHCYACHWESDAQGMIDPQYHQGYNFKTYTSIRNAQVDLVVWRAGLRPTWYNTTTAVTFLASSLGTGNERTEVAKITNHCLGCHSDQNSTTQPFGDCKTPDQYAWDAQSIAARYSQTGTTAWGKYNSTTYTNANQKDKVTKAFSAHGNAAANQGGWSASTGVDGAITNTRNGSQNVQCFDCHSSHGSKLVGTTSSYVTFNGTHNGGNLKETQAGKGGYSMTYKAAASTDPSNPYNAGAAQCFDCHLTQSSGTTPWGYQSTFGASAPINGYFDSDRFGVGSSGAEARFPFKQNANKNGHLHASSSLTNAAATPMNGLCTPCHDPHGVSPSLGSKEPYGVPLLKGTWMTSPYKEDTALDGATSGARGSSAWRNNSGPAPVPYINTDQSTFNNGRITEDDSTFAGLCLRCHAKSNLTDGVQKNQAWKSVDRIHESVKGWGANTQHSYPCSKCHTAHVTALPRLMVTNCLDYKHRGRGASGGQPGSGSDSWVFPYSGGPQSGSGSFPKGKDNYRTNCHTPAGAWPDNSWNVKTPW